MNRHCSQCYVDADGEIRCASEDLQVLPVKEEKYGRARLEALVAVYRTLPEGTLGRTAADLAAELLLLRSHLPTNERKVVS